MNTSEEAATLTLIANIAQAHGCKLIDVDLEKQLINLEGPEENRIACALALEEALDS